MNYQLAKIFKDDIDHSFWYKLCNCCPYGYHIDLDFVQYCDSFGHVDHTASMKRRKDRRRQRRSMVVLLGLEDLSTITNIQKEQISEEQPLETIEKCSLVDKFSTVSDDLNNAVLDFEQTFQNSRMFDNASKQEVLPVSIVLRSKTPMSPGICKSNIDMDHDLNSPGYGLIPPDLQNIRKQMALSLERTKMLEELVKHIPLLQAQLAELKEENRQLLLQIKMNKEENSFTNGQLDSHASLTLPINKISSPHRRDFGVTCSLLIPTGSSDVQQANTCDWNVDGYSDKWYLAKSNFLTDGRSNISNRSNIKKKILDPILITKETQTTLPTDKIDSAIQTLHNTDEQRVDNTQEYEKLYRSVGISACIFTSEAYTEPTVISVATSGVSDDTIDSILCLKCAAPTTDNINTSVCNELNVELQSRTIGCQYDLYLEHKSVQCDNKRTNVNISTNTNVIPNLELFIESLHKDMQKQILVNHSVGCQYEYSSLNKGCQVDFKLKDKAVQYDMPKETIETSEFCSKCNNSTNELAGSVDTSLNDQSYKISLSSLTLPRSKSYCSSEMQKGSDSQSGLFGISKATQIVPKVTHKATQCENISYFKKFETKLGSRETTSESDRCITKTAPKDSDDTLKEENNISVPSRIPRPQSMPENRNFERQNTYNIDLSTCVSLFTEDVKHVDKVSNNPEAVNYDVNSSLNSVSSMGLLPAYSEPQLETSSERKKAIPSKSMRAAVKVLSDCLKKGQTENLEDQLKNSINIVQLEWFKISSLIDANPLDVEDYLDFFEDFSCNLLQYIVNMVDANGNTAMHYAVSHGNFDIVSILLDSKVCDVNQTNKVGYTSVMLVSLVEISSAEHASVVWRLFKMADVNVKAKQHGQTALMLAVSHGRLDMVQMLLEAGADINIQDEDGSTALMCASEHGHNEIVKLFLDQAECDSTVADIDGSTALTIAMEAGHRPIGVLLYTHQRMCKSSSQRSKIP